MKKSNKMPTEPMKFPPPVNCRLEGWARTHDRVAVIVMNGDSVRIFYGVISSHPTIGDKIADNVTQTAVWGDQAFNPDADSADDAHELDLRIDDPRLLKKEEALLLRQNTKVARAWFKGVYPPKTIGRIIKALEEAYTAS
jgi:hypothetical protein